MSRLERREGKGICWKLADFGHALGDWRFDKGLCSRPDSANHLNGRTLSTSYCPRRTSIKTWVPVREKLLTGVFVTLPLAWGTIPVRLIYEGGYPHAQRH